MRTFPEKTPQLAKTTRNVKFVGKVLKKCKRNKFSRSCKVSFKVSFMFFENFPKTKKILSYLTRKYSRNPIIQRKNHKDRIINKTVMKKPKNFQ